MRWLFSILLACISCSAATPSFRSFATNEFTVTPSISDPQIIHLNLNPLQFDTNASSVTVTITNVSGVIGGSLWTNKSGLLQPIDLTPPIFFTNSIVFGPGVTNQLFRNGDYLRVSQSDPLGYSLLEFVNTATASPLTRVGSSSFGGSLSTAGSQLDLGISTPSRGLLLSSLGFTPRQDVVINLGAQANRFGDAWLGGSLYVSGFINGTNYSRIAVSHTGTNGPIVIDSQASGTAGDPSQFNVSANGTNVLEFGWNHATANFLDVVSPLGNARAELFLSDTVGQTAFTLIAPNNEQVAFAPDSTGGDLNMAPFEFDRRAAANTNVVTMNVKNDTTNTFSLYANGSIATASQTNRWIFKGVVEGVTTNITVNINGKDYTFQAW